jgi:hypothetical protein
MAVYRRWKYKNPSSTSHRNRITRAFLIEEANIVKKVLKAQAASSKKK